MRVGVTVMLGALLLLEINACDAPAPSSQLSLTVAPLSLPGIVEATYALSVVNGAGDTIWSRTLTSTRFGDGAGSLSYVGACDTDSNPNTVRLEVLGLEDTAGPLIAGVDFANPAPAGQPLEIAVECLANQDVDVRFDITIARAAKQGFFDVAVEFQDIFCSAKLDCQKSLGGQLQNLTLLSDPLTGQRNQTAVLGFSCTAGQGQDTHLHMNDLVISCASGDQFTIDPSAGPGQLNPPYTGGATELLFQAATYRGAEQLGTYNKGYWNVAMGLNRASFAALGACTLETNATATDGPLIGGRTPAGTTFPYIAWDVTLTDASGALACTQHPLGGGNGVAIAYTPRSGAAFAASYSVADGEVLALSAYGDGSDGSVPGLGPSAHYLDSEGLGAASDGNGAYADGIAYQVVANPSGGTLQLEAAPAGINVGDEVLLINLQGAAGDTADVGRYTFLRVTGKSGSALSVYPTVTESFDGASFANQKIVVQRVPHYDVLTISAGATVTTHAWDGLTTAVSGNSGRRTGVVAFRAVNLSVDGTVSADTLGYRGGSNDQAIDADGFPGESLPGFSGRSQSANGGGGGGGDACPWNGSDWIANSGAGGAYGSSAPQGAYCDSSCSNVGNPGATYGDAPLSVLNLGSGGGAEGSENVDFGTATLGGAGGGAVFIGAQQATINGSVTSRGGDGQAARNGDRAGSGAGSGGAIYLWADTLTAAAGSLLATGGQGGAQGSWCDSHSGNPTRGGDGGDGRVVLRYTTLNGGAFPATSAEQSAADPDPGYSALP